MPKPLKIVVNKNTPKAIEVFSQLGSVIALSSQEITKESLKNADALIVRSETRVDKGLIEGTPVRFVGTVTIGTDHVDLGYLDSKGIVFASAPGSNSTSVAEYMAATLCVLAERTGESLNKRTIGIVGVGNVGSKVVGVARAFGMEVLLNDPPVARKTGDTSYRSLDDLMGADIISLHVPLTNDGPDATYHLFDETRINRMKNSAVLINTSRGGVVETEALHQSLLSKHISAAILDVWENEPEISPELLQEVLLGTPHIAGYSLDGKLNAVRMVHESLCRYLNRTIDRDIMLRPDSYEETRISIPPNLLRVDEIVSSAVRQAYDIELDDRLLRKILSLETGSRGRYFMQVRAEYRIRREFHNLTVELARSQEAASQILGNLGFRISVKEEEPQGVPRRSSTD